MNHQEMIDYVSDDLRNITIQSKITSWLNLAAVDIATSYVFGHLNDYATVNTVVGNPDVTLESDFLWMKSASIPVRQYKLVPKDESLISDEWPDYRTRQGTVEYYYINGLKLGLYMVPSAIEVISYNFQHRPVKLSALSDISEFPEEWHELQCQKAIGKGYSYEGNTEGVIKSERLEAKILKRLGASAYKRLDTRVIMGASPPIGRPLYPRLPSHFPRVRR